tara:strand:+ start:1081 stop:1716 length:636 start_codon:yes stop_codon:yes gene_type:complete
MDLSVVQKKSEIPIYSFSVKNIFSPPLLDIVGESGLLETDYVEINGVKSSTISIVNDRRVLVEIPESVSEVLSLKVISTNSKASNIFNLENGLGSRGRTVSGIDRVIQKVVKVLLTSPNSDVLNPSLGAGVNTFIAKNYPSHGALSSEMVTAISLAEKAIIAAEVRDDISDAEKLGSITVVEMVPIDKVGVSLSLEIRSKDGSTGRASLTL